MYKLLDKACNEIIWKHVYMKFINGNMVADHSTTGQLKLYGSWIYWEDILNTEVWLAAGVEWMGWSY